MDGRLTESLNTVCHQNVKLTQRSKIILKCVSIRIKQITGVYSIVEAPDHAGGRRAAICDGGRQENHIGGDNQPGNDIIGCSRAGIQETQPDHILGIRQKGHLWLNRHHKVSGRSHGGHRIGDGISHMIRRVIPP